MNNDSEANEVFAEAERTLAADLAAVRQRVRATFLKNMSAPDSQELKAQLVIYAAMTAMLLVGWHALAVVCTMLLLLPSYLMEVYTRWMVKDSTGEPIRASSIWLFPALWHIWLAILLFALIVT